MGLKKNPLLNVLHELKLNFHYFVLCIYSFQESPWKAMYIHGLQGVLSLNNLILSAISENYPQLECQQNIEQKDQTPPSFFFFFWPFFDIFQMELQDDGITMGFEHSLSKDIISIINNVFQAPWGGSHTCQKEEKAIECNLCQSSILCYQLACELLERLAPKEESRLVVSS